MKYLPWLVLVVLVAVGFGQSNRKRSSTPRFSELSPDDSKRLDQQRALIAAAVKQRYGAALTRTKSDLPLLQRLLDDHAFGKSQTYELQNLGVAFGDVLATEFALRWVMVSDEYGTDPTLRFKKTSINVNALTMISKRVERDEHVDVYELVRKTAEALSEARSDFVRRPSSMSDMGIYRQARHRSRSDCQLFLYLSGGRGDRSCRKC